MDIDSMDIKWNIKSPVIILLDSHLASAVFFCLSLWPFDFQAGVHARIQIYWCTSSIFRHLKLELLTQFPASNDEKYINVVYIWRKFVSFYGYVHWRMTTEISVMYGSEKVKPSRCIKASFYVPKNILYFPTTRGFRTKISMKLVYQYIYNFL